MQMRLKQLQKHLNLSFHQENLLQTALTHRSHAYECRRKGRDTNERLEFLGDAVLDLIISEYLYRQYPHLSEGAMTKIKAIVVSSQLLSRKAATLGLGKYIFLGRGEVLTGGRSRSSLLADVFEALLGAIYLDQGLESVRAFVLKHLLPEIERLYQGDYINDYKTELQELIQGQQGTIPQYHTIAERGPDHQKEFLVEVRLRGEVLGLGQGRSKKEAEQQAAHQAWKRLVK